MYENLRIGSRVLQLTSTGFHASSSYCASSSCRTRHSPSTSRFRKRICSWLRMTSGNRRITAASRPWTEHPTMSSRESVAFALSGSDLRAGAWGVRSPSSSTTLTKIESCHIASSSIQCRSCKTTKPDALVLIGRITLLNMFLRIILKATTWSVPTRRAFGS